MTKNGHKLCVSHPDEADWVKKRIDALEKRKEKHAKIQVHDQPKQLYFCLSLEGNCNKLASNISCPLFAGGVSDGGEAEKILRRSQL